MGEEEADFLYDLRLARRWKRRRIAYENGGLNSCSNKDLIKTVGQNNQHNDASVDSDYVNVSNDMEARTVDSDYMNVSNDMEARTVDSDYMNVSNDMEGFVDFDVGCVNNAAAAGSDDNVREVFDPDYMTFLNNLKEDGESYVLELALDETLIVVKYELKALRNNSRRDDNECSRIFQDGETARTSRVSKGTQTNLREPVVEKNVVKETEDPILLASGDQDLVDESYGEFLKLLEDGEYLKCTFADGKKVTYEESDSENVAEDHSLPSRRHSPEVTNFPKHQCNPRIISDVADEGYLEFLKSLKDGDHLECTLGGKRVVYEGNDYDSEVTILEDNPFSDGKCIPIVDVDSEECIETPGSEFREKLMEILRKPYDRMEYEKFWKEASLQKPMEGQRVLRRQTISYRLAANAKSYLEHDEYSDLALLVDQAQGDQRRILNLLRGFFYWLQNLAHKGAFKPWLDSSCLSILPPIEPGTFASGSDHKAKCAVQAIHLSDCKPQDPARL